MERGKIVYLSGMITDNENHKKEFKEAELFLIERGYIVINPAELDEVAEGLTYEQYMQICYRLIDVADIIFMVSGWQKSKGANAELSYAKSLGKKVMYQDYYAPFRKVGECEISENRSGL
jgi:nucleoside 2-deoxyribosyltransferase